MRNILAIICSKRVAACCGMFVCPSYICNIACKVNSASQTIFIYKHVKYLIGTLCSENALYAQVERDLAEQGTSCLHWKSAFTGKIYNIPTERITFRHHTSHPSLPNIQQRLAHSHKGQRRHIRFPAILCLCQRNLDIEEGYECVRQKGITPNLEAVIAHDAQVVKNPNDILQIRHKSAYTQCNCLNKACNTKVFFDYLEEWVTCTLRRIEDDPGSWDKERKSYHHIGGRSGHPQWTPWVTQRLCVKTLYYIEYLGLDVKDFPQINGIFYFCEAFLMPENWSTSTAYAVCVDHGVRVHDL
ncbi:hypothetical protein D6D06_07933 [Aureobasidium pullulans]|nr:hypothetical protein D6D06_07933 [Aureobasidium pullulans]